MDCLANISTTKMVKVAPFDKCSSIASASLILIYCKIREVPSLDFKQFLVRHVTGEEDKETGWGLHYCSVVRNYSRFRNDVEIAVSA